MITERQVAMDASDQQILTGRVAQWFPLVPRTRPTAHDLASRVDEVRALASAASHGTHDRRISSAAEAHNKAALIVSDCGLNDLAEQLCWQQFDIFHSARPLTAKTGKLALQPLVNLARLLIRTGNGNRAHAVLSNAYDAIRNAGNTAIDGRDIHLHNLATTAEDRHELRKFLWTVLLADGTRALTTTGRWDQALLHVHRHNGIGTRLLDGRQIAILARCASGDCDGALELLDATATPEPWEKAVAAYLRALSLHVDGRPTGPAVRAMVNHYIQLEPTPGQSVFRTRLGLCALDLATTPDRGAARQLAAKVIEQALAAADATSAWDLLTHAQPNLITTATDEQALTELVESSGLRRGTMPAHAIDDLTEAVRTSEALLAYLLDHPTSEHEGPRPWPRNERELSGLEGRTRR